MKIWEEERRSCRRRENKKNVFVYSDFLDSGILIWGFVIDSFTNGQLNINIFIFFIDVSVCKV
jgi:hypothetical protein